MVAKFRLRNPKEGDESQDLCVDRMMILKRIIVKTVFGLWIGFISLRVEVGSCFYEHGNDLSDTI
jgi:hypothetical protein